MSLVDDICLSDVQIWLVLSFSITSFRGIEFFIYFRSKYRVRLLVSSKFIYGSKNRTIVILSPIEFGRNSSICFIEKLFWDLDLD